MVELEKSKAKIDLKSVLSVAFCLILIVGGQGLVFLAVETGVFVFGVNMEMPDIVMLYFNLQWVGLAVQTFGFALAFLLAIKKTKVRRLLFVALTFGLLFVSFFATVPPIKAALVDTTNYFLDVPIPDGAWWIGQFTNSSIFALNMSNWDASIVADNEIGAVLSQVVGNGRKIQIGDGNFLLNSSVTIQNSSMWLLGSLPRGRSTTDGTVIRVGSAGNLDFYPDTGIAALGGGTWLRDITIENIIFIDNAQTYTSPQAVHCIYSSAWDSAERIWRLTIRGCQFRYFTGCVPVVIPHPEHLLIEHNDFHYTNDGFIVLDSPMGYSFSNNDIENNGFYAHGGGRSAQEVFMLNITSGWATTTNNHWYSDYDTARTCAILVQTVATNARTGGVSCYSERAEGCDLIETRAYNSSNSIKVFVRDAYALWNPNGAWSVMFNLGAYTYKSTIEGCHYDYSSANSVVFLDNASDNSGYGNEFLYNYFPTIINCTGNRYTVYMHNYPSSLGVKSTYNRNGNYATYWGSNTNGFSNGTDITVRTAGCYLSINNNVISITIKDASGNTVANLGTSCNGYYVPYNWKFNVVYSATPTYILSWE